MPALLATTNTTIDWAAFGIVGELYRLRALSPVLTRGALSDVVANRLGQVAAIAAREMVRLVQLEVQLKLAGISKRYDLATRPA